MCPREERRAALAPSPQPHSSRLPVLPLVTPPASLPAPHVQICPLPPCGSPHHGPRSSQDKARIPSLAQGVPGVCVRHLPKHSSGLAPWAAAWKWHGPPRHMEDTGDQRGHWMHPSPWASAGHSPSSPAFSSRKSPPSGRGQFCPAPSDHGQTRSSRAWRGDAHLSSSTREAEEGGL
jgi:hypothetical protein